MSQAPVRLPGAMQFNYADQLITGQKQGLAMVYGTMQRQAMMMALNSIYRTLAGMMVIGMALCLLLPRARNRTLASGH
jgi:hypothetical protein